jgi:3-deoxy-D-manno-octulosonic-acid transferase
LLNEVRRLLADRDEAKQIGDRARVVVERNQGATEKTLEVIANFIPK